MGPPQFPPPFVIERSRSLGFGTGPWARERLVELWGAPTADKYISEAKAAGWLVSPYRGVYHVPAAQDLMVVPWLPEPARSEFLISRTLTAADLRAWCLSAWCRERGLELREPVFVTDLTNLSTTPNAGPAADRKALRASAAGRVAGRHALPFLENLLIVPALPPLAGRPRRRIALVPESSEAQSRKTMESNLAQAFFGIGGLIAMALDKDPAPAFDAIEALKGRDVAARGIPYAVDSDVQDEAWIVALLASVGTSRIEELVTGALRPKSKAATGAIQRWASLIGPPQPVSSWKETLRNGPFPFLLVPPSLWSEMGADQAARRYRMLSQLSGE